MVRPRIRPPVLVATVSQMFLRNARIRLNSPAVLALLCASTCVLPYVEEFLLEHTG